MIEDYEKQRRDFRENFKYTARWALKWKNGTWQGVIILHNALAFMSFGPMTTSTTGDRKMRRWDIKIYLFVCERFILSCLARRELREMINNVFMVLLKDRRSGVVYGHIEEMYKNILLGFYLRRRKFYVFNKVRKRKQRKTNFFFFFYIQPSFKVICDIVEGIIAAYLTVLKKQKLFISKIIFLFLVCLHRN